MIRPIITLVLLFGMVFFGYQLYVLYYQKTELDNDLLKSGLEMASLTDENDRLRSDIDYFQNEENLARELQSRFNYAKPGERMIIVVPKKENND